MSPDGLTQRHQQDRSRPPPLPTHLLHLLHSESACHCCCDSVHLHVCCWPQACKIASAQKNVNRCTIPWSAGCPSAYAVYMANTPRRGRFCARYTISVSCRLLSTHPQCSCHKWGIHSQRSLLAWHGLPTDILLKWTCFLTRTEPHTRRHPRLIRVDMHRGTNQAASRMRISVAGPGRAAMVSST